MFGGSGWIGRTVHRSLTARGLTPVIADLRGPGDGSAFVRADVGDLDQVLDACRQVRPQVVINLAALLAPATEVDLLRSERTNVSGMLNVFQACRLSGIRRCVFASSIAVYGDQALFGESAVAEDCHGWPAMLYGWHKLVNEASAACFERDHAVQCVALRLSTVFGPGPAAINQALNELVAGVAAGGSVRCALPPATEFNLLHVDDAGEAFAMLATSPTPRHRVYNSGGEHIALKGFIRLLERLRPGVEVILDDAGAPPVPRVTRVDWTRLREEFDIVRQPLEQRIAGDLELARAAPLSNQRES